MTSSPFEMKFDPQTINHLGLRMYSTLPPALAELVSNSYDADAEHVTITLSEKGGKPTEIVIEDDGIGMSFDEIGDKFLTIGRNRRTKDGDTPSPRFGRLPTGKKGLGKLALFGLAQTITVTTCQAGMLNELRLDWDELMSTVDGPYRPSALKTNEQTGKPDGTTIRLHGLKRKTKFDVSGLADSLSRIFLLDDNFKLILVTSAGDRIAIDNKRKYNSLKREFTWILPSPPFVPKGSVYEDKIEGEIITTEKPLTPASGLRGITLYSRGKLVNSPEFFSVSDSSHFYQYLTGWIRVDFIDELEDDVISTDRKSIDWEHPEMINLRDFLSGIVAQVNADWRRLRKEKKDKDLKGKTGIDTAEWIKTMPADVGKNTTRIVDLLSGEDALEKFTPVIKALHAIVPEYPLLHWRHLHDEVRMKSWEYYQRKDYYHAFTEAMKRYTNAVKEKSGLRRIKDADLMPAAFKLDGGVLDIMGDYRRGDGTDFESQTRISVHEGQHFLSHGIYAAGRNPLAHEEIDELKSSDLFSEKDCLDLLSLLSHLFKRLDNSKKKP